MKSNVSVRIVATALLISPQLRSQQTAPAKPPEEAIVTLERFVSEAAGGDPNYILPNDPNDALGFSKRPVETPRSMTVVSSEMISNLSLSNVQDLTVIAPNTASTSRWGVQGNIDIRAQAADIYFRGMKRVEPQGNSRTVLGANDQIEIVKGPPPPYFGAGKVGGYTNMTPKAGRSRKGAYLDKDEGFFQLIVGDFGRREASIGYGGPTQLSSTLKGGYYLYAMVDDSDTYFQHVPGRQRIIQAALSQEITRKWRVETGVNYQETISAGAALTRLTQDMISNGNVWAGRPLVNLDTDGSGKVSRREMEVNSPNPLTSVLSANNMAPLGGNFSAASFVTASRVTADVTKPRVNSALEALVQMRPEFVALIKDQQTLNLLNTIPKGLVLDPNTVKLTKMDFSAVALEKELRAKLGLIYLDFVNDIDSDFTLKNQIFFDAMDQFKDSEQPYYQKLDQYVVENKFTAQKRFSNVPTWMALNTIGSVNVRNSRTGGMTGGGDYDDRQDLAAPFNQKTPYDTFVSPRENSTYENGLPFTADNDTVFTESGIGVMADMMFLERFSVMAGGRLDYVQVDGIQHAGIFSSTVGTNGSPVGRYNRPTDVTFEGDDLGKSWTLSGTYRLPYGIIPYYTYGVQAVLQDGGNISTIGGPAVANGGVYEDATIKEVGVKGSMFKDRFYWAMALYQQGKTSVTLDTNGAEITSGSVDSSRARGAELELRWVPSKQFYLTSYVVSQKSTTTILAGTRSVRIAGTQLGFADVKDASGNVIYPAEAFSWGGQNTITVPTGTELETPGYPNLQVGGSANYAFKSGFSAGMSMNYNSHVQSGWAQKVIFPSYALWNVNLGYKWKDWTAKFDVMNAFDKQYFRGRIGGGNGDALASSGLPRRLQVTLAKAF